MMWSLTPLCVTQLLLLEASNMLMGTGLSFGSGRDGRIGERTLPKYAVERSCMRTMASVRGQRINIQGWLGSDIIRACGGISSRRWLDGFK